MIHNYIMLYLSHSHIIAWNIPWTEEPSGLQSMRSQRVRYDCELLTLTFPGWWLIWDFQRQKYEA